LGGVDQSPPLAGPQFSSVWNAAPLAALLARIQTMPPENPGSLAVDENIDILAYMLWYNGLPAGEEALDIAQTALVAPRFQPRDQWTTYGGNLASQRYSPLDQINADNFKDLQIAWRLPTTAFGPRPDTLYSATPLYANGMLYTTAGTRRAVLALDPATGEVRWMHSEDEGTRGTAGARQGAGRGLAWWSNADGSDKRVIYVTPGYRMLALDAETGQPVPSFGDNGVVDLKQNFDQDIDPNGGN